MLSFPVTGGEFLESRIAFDVLLDVFPIAGEQYVALIKELMKGSLLPLVKVVDVSCEELLFYLQRLDQIPSLILA